MRQCKYGERYGTADYEGPPEVLVTTFREDLRKLLRAKPEPADATSKVQGELMQQWLRLGHDPETCIADWTHKGAFLGINVPIPSCGIFPPGGDHLIATNFETSDLAELLLEPGENYASCRDMPADTEIEVQRNLDAGNCNTINRIKAQELYPNDSIHKLGLIVKQTPIGETKRRIVVYAR